MNRMDLSEERREETILDIKLIVKHIPCVSVTRKTEPLTLLNFKQCIFWHYRCIDGAMLLVLLGHEDPKVGVEQTFDVGATSVSMISNISVSYSFWKRTKHTFIL